MPYNPLISVMIPVYNREKYIAQAIDSVLLQDYRPLEIIVVDDGSTDGTAEIVKQYAPDMVRYFYQENRGHATARNTCFAAACGEFLAWLDSDDYYLPGKLSAQIRYLETHPNCELVFTQVEDFFDGPNSVEMDKQQCARISIGDRKVYPASMLARRVLLERVGPRDESLRVAEDVDWLARAQIIFKTDISHCIDRIYLRRRMHINSLSYQRYDHTTQQISKIFSKYMRQNFLSKNSL